RKLDIARQAWKVHKLVGKEQWFNLTARRQAYRIAGVIIAVAIAFFHILYLPMPDEIGAPGRRLPVGSGKDKLGASERGGGHRHTLPIDFFQLGKSVYARHDCTAKISGRLQPFF